MKGSAFLTIGLTIGLSAGYMAYPSFHLESPRQAAAAMSTPQSSALTRTQTDCELSSAQLDRLADRLAPTLVARLAASTAATGEKSRVAKDGSTSAGQTETQKAQAFARATQLIDQLIADRRVTPEGISNVQTLLQQSGQSDRAFEVLSRISAAVNQGELTPAEAGLLPAEIGR
jgi:hypothetical protein